MFVCTNTSVRLLNGYAWMGLYFMEEHIYHFAQKVKTSTSDQVSHSDFG